MSAGQVPDGSRPGGVAGELGFTPAFLEQLRSLAIQNRRMLPGPGAGQRRSRRAGSSVELLDYRNYVPGDDLRRLDWNVLARLDALFVRLFRAEENLLVRLLLDRSRSMSFGAPTKFDLARRLAGALAYVALMSYDRVVTAGCGGAGLDYLPAAQGEAGAARVWRFLATLQPDGRGDFSRQATEAASRLREPGLTILLTDGLYPDGLIPTLKRLLAAGHELAVVQVLEPAELRPVLTGDWRLLDAEQPSAQVEVTLTPVTSGDYQERINAYLQEVRDFCRRQGAAWFLIPADTALEEAVLKMLRSLLAG